MQTNPDKFLEATMKLYSHPMSPNCRKVTVTAALLDLSLDHELVDLAIGAQRKTAYLAINPNGLVPTLRDGDFTLWESNAIMQYLASKNPGTPLWPDDARARADVSRWQSWELAHWLPAASTLMWEHMFKQLVGQGDPDPAEVKKGYEKFHRFAGILNGHLATRDYLTGKTLTLADISVAAGLMYAEAARLPVDEHPNISRWFARIESFPAWQATAPAMA